LQMDVGKTRLDDDEPVRSKRLYKEREHLLAPLQELRAVLEHVNTASV